MNDNDRWLLGIGFLVFVLFAWNIERQLKRIIDLLWDIRQGNRD